MFRGTRGVNVTVFCGLVYETKNAVCCRFNTLTLIQQAYVLYLSDVYCSTCWAAIVGDEGDLHIFILKGGGPSTAYFD